MSESFHSGLLHVCSFHDASGSGEVAGRMHYWDFSERFGPLFTTSSGRELRKQPGTRTHAWVAFERWRSALKAEKRVMNTVGEETK